MSCHRFDNSQQVPFLTFVSKWQPFDKIWVNFLSIWLHQSCNQQVSELVLSRHWIWNVGCQVDLAGNAHIKSTKSCWLTFALSCINWHYEAIAHPFKLSSWLTVTLFSLFDSLWFRNCKSTCNLDCGDETECLEKRSLQSIEINDGEFSHALLKALRQIHPPNPKLL